MERHLAASYGVIPDNTLFLESVGTQLPGFISIYSVVSFFQCHVKSLRGFIYFNNLKVLPSLRAKDIPPTLYTEYGFFSIAVRFFCKGINLCRKHRFFTMRRCCIKCNN